jgi:hypothetical protein
MLILDFITRGDPFASLKDASHQYLVFFYLLLFSFFMIQFNIKLWLLFKHFENVYELK